ncbi:DUF6446 family protein [Algirhabdus cladophorae]|uniref:DUF6446 family protein n=1 Tax=Algirhabdus cladophorae TaxID=3377108 RepID=UPI003B849BBD
MARILLGGMLVLALIAGAAMYYLQVYAYYDTVSDVPEQSVQMTTLVGNAPEPILYEAFEAIDADSSPLRYRACFTTPQSISMMTETYVTYEVAEPRVAPGWFECFDADAIGAAIETGEAVVFMGTENVEYGIDRVIAVFDDGRGFAWHQINACGEVVFDGQPAPEDCPTPPEGLR